MAGSNDSDGEISGDISNGAAVVSGTYSAS